MRKFELVEGALSGAGFHESTAHLVEISGRAITSTLES